MSQFLKPQSPLQHKDGDYFYPLTTADQVVLEDDNRLNAVLNNIIYFNDVNSEKVSTTVDADTLGMRPASDYALKSDLENSSSGVSSWNDLSDKPFIPTKVSDLEQDVDMMPEVTAEDNGKFLRVVDGTWAAVSVPNAEEASF